MVNRIMKKSGIGILTGGGDVPGLNSVIKSVVYGAITGVYRMKLSRRVFLENWTPFQLKIDLAPRKCQKTINPSQGPWRL
jgi:hypothetical protein